MYNCAFFNRYDYKDDKWYYNAGHVTGIILKKFPYLAHKVKNTFGTDILHMDCLFFEYCRDWRKKLEAVHLLINHRSYLDEESPIKEFDEFNVLNYSFTFGEMSREIIEKINFK